MAYDVIVIGAGLSGLTAASLMAKRGLKVAVIDKSYNPGGSCGVFKRKNATFDQGAAMLFGFGEKGFNAHRFVFNCLEEPIDVIRHDLLYCVNYKSERIKFWPDIKQFAEELSRVFPKEKENIRRFYKDLVKMYRHVIVGNPTYTTPDETDKRNSLRGLFKHPVSYAKFLSYMNISTKSLLQKYFSDPEIFKFFNKLTSTYCYTTVDETPAILAAIMFVDNHIGGSYYPAGSTIFLPGKLEKVIEENDGDMIMNQEVVEIIFQDNKAIGVKLKNGQELLGSNLVYSGTVWNLYGKLIDQSLTEEKRRNWAASQVATYPSIVLYAIADRKVIPDDTAPIEMLVGNPDRIDESEVTVYIASIDDHTLCDASEHVILAIGPSFENWKTETTSEYQAMKEKEKQRLMLVLDKRFPGFQTAVRHAEIATPRTIERYTNKNGGAVAGPKQMLGQHMFKRLHTRTEWENLFCCGESTIMGTGTPTVTTSGISAANAVLKRVGLEPYIYNPGRPEFVSIIRKPVRKEDLNKQYSEEQRAVMERASACRFCEHPSCINPSQLDIRGIMRRVSVGNIAGALKILKQKNVRTELINMTELSESSLSACEQRCILNAEYGTPVNIKEVIGYILKG